MGRVSNSCSLPAHLFSDTSNLLLFFRDDASKKSLFLYVEYVHLVLFYVHLVFLYVHLVFLCRLNCRLHSCLSLTQCAANELRVKFSSDNRSQTATRFAKPLSEFILYVYILTLYGF